MPLRSSSLRNACNHIFDMSKSLFNSIIVYFNSLIYFLLLLLLFPLLLVISLPFFGGDLGGVVVFGVFSITYFSIYFLILLNSTVSTASITTTVTAIILFSSFVHMFLHCYHVH